MEVCVSAPGKSILMGEHAAVYGRPALVAAVDRRTRAEIRAIDGGAVRLDLPEVGVGEVVGWAELRRYTASCREAWERYRDDPRPELFRRVRGKDPAHLVKIALGEAAASLEDEDPPGMEVSLSSEIPLGAGFGSSAAAAVAVVGAYLALRGTELPADELHRLTLEVERRQHGLPSGVDDATVIHGGIVYATRDEGVLAVEPLTASRTELRRLRLFHSGTPAESTGEVVAAVRERLRTEPVRYEPLLDRMAAVTEELRRELTLESPSRGRIRDAIRIFEACLEDLGVVPAPIRDLVRRVERAGGAAKVSGAGSLAGPGAGSVLVYSPEDEDVTNWGFLGPLEALEVHLGDEGVRREP